MFIFRVEHKRELCTDDRYREGGVSLTGHGTYKRCEGFKGKVANFGFYGCPPVAIMLHERCAVTSWQWRNWIDEDYSCRNVFNSCYSGYCGCPSTREISLFDEWQIVCYWVEDSAKGIDWRMDNGQIVFNPEFAVNMGTVTEDEVYSLDDVWA